MGGLCEVRSEMRDEGKREEKKGGGAALFLVVVAGSGLGRWATKRGR